MKSLYLLFAIFYLYGCGVASTKRLPYSRTEPPAGLASFPLLLDEAGSDSSGSNVSFVDKVAGVSSIEYVIELLPPSSTQHLPVMSLSALVGEQARTYHFKIEDFDCDGTYFASGTYFPEQRVFKPINWQTPFFWGERIPIYMGFKKGQLRLKIGDEEQVLKLAEAPKKIKISALSGRVKIWERKVL